MKQTPVYLNNKGEHGAIIVQANSSTVEFIIEDLDGFPHQFRSYSLTWNQAEQFSDALKKSAKMAKENREDWVKEVLEGT